MEVDASLTIGAATQALNEVQHEAVEHEDDKQNGEELRQLVLNDEDDVIVPVTLNDSDNTGGCILQGQGQKVHDCCVSLSGMS